MTDTEHYGGRVYLRFSEKQHKYRANVDGGGFKHAPGVTTILKVIDKPKLPDWRHRLIRQAFVENIPMELTEDLIDDCLNAPRREMEAAGVTGTQVHDALEILAQGGKPKISTGPVQLAVEGWLAWTKQHQIEPWHLEKRLYSIEGNYAGTCDFIGTIDGELTVADYKTSKYIYNDNFLQLAAYSMAYEEETGERPMRRIIIKCPKVEGGEFEIGESIDFDKDDKGFLSALELYKRNLTSGKNFTVTRPLSRR